MREKEEEIKDNQRNNIKTNVFKTTLNDMFELYMSGKTELKQSTRTNYNYMYNNYIREELGVRKITTIKYSDIKKFYNSLINEKSFKPNSMEIINTILHPVFTLAVRDGYSDFIFTSRVGYIHNPQTINRAIKRIIRDHNKEEKELAKKEKREPLEIRDFSVHSLRHTFCTRFCEKMTYRL